jgi:hypothetical protein
MPEPGPEPDEPGPESVDNPVRVSGDIDRHRNAREDTELARLRRNYSRASSARLQGSSIASRSRKPSTLLERLTHIVSGFWRHQVSITVEHSTCRDHLGVFLRVLLSRPNSSDKVINLVLPDWGLGSPIPNCQCIKSSGILTTPFHHIFHLQNSAYWTTAKTLF